MKKYILKGEVSTTQKNLSEKPVDVIAEFTISNLDEISLNEIKSNKILIENNQGYKTNGLLFFDLYKSSRNFSNLPINENNNYNLKLYKNENVTRFPILILKKEHEVEIGDNNFRFYYSFFQISKCIQDDIFLFEKQFEFIKNPRLFQFVATRCDNEVKKGLINVHNLDACNQVVREKLSTIGFISNQIELLDLKIKEVTFDDSNIFLDL